MSLVEVLPVDPVTRDGLAPSSCRQARARAPRRRAGRRQRSPPPPATPRRRVLGHEHAPGPGLDCGGGEIATVDPRSRHSDEQVPGPQVARIDDRAPRPAPPWPRHEPPARRPGHPRGVAVDHGRQSSYAIGHPEAQICDFAADTDKVSAQAISALARVAGRRFQSFSEAADSVLDVLEQELPSAKLIVGELNADDGAVRVVDVRGEGFEMIERGSALPWTAQEANGDGGVRRGGMLDPAVLRELEVKKYLAVPFDTSNGTTLGALCALGSESGLFTQEHAELLTIGGRLLNYEWESVKSRADVRRMEEQLRDPARTDKVTGLPNRPA